jgi:CYTH domain-containing protein
MQTRLRSLSDNKYARPEYERRFLLREKPATLVEADAARIVDHYIKGTRLRLRRITRPSEDTVEYKLALKFADASLPAGCVAITNLYLSEAEYDYLRPFVGADSVVKRRYPFLNNGWRYGVDVFEGAHEGLVLAEIELETAEEFAGFPMPDFAVRDVTTDPFFSGGQLATASRSLITVKLTEFLK